MNFRRKHAEPQTGFQIAPMIDVVFILLSFFIATQMYARWEKEIDVKLPTASTGRVPNRLKGEVIINVLRDGKIVINQQRFKKDALKSRLSRLVELFPGQPVIIRADRQSSYEDVLGVIDICRQVDIWNISFATSAAK